VLQALLSRWPGSPRVSLITTDGFLLPNATLAERGLMARKGFPESYDTRGLLRFLSDIKAGRRRVEAPVYSHLSYDVIPGASVVLDEPDIVIVEGLNVLQPARLPPDGEHVPFVSDFFDFSVYLDAEESLLRTWYVERFMRLRDTAFRDPRSYFVKYAALGEAEALEVAGGVWDAINLVNLRENIRPTRQRAKLILRKGHDHLIDEVSLRRI
jgi:type I pantothenate kinase